MYVRLPMPRPLPALLLLVALLGGLGASSVHLAHHGQDWEDSRAAHVAGGAHDADTDLLTEPCLGGEAHETPCAVCSGFAGTSEEARTIAPIVPSAEQKAVAEVARAVHQRAVAPARGPPPSVA